MRILFVAMAHSIHATRWINQLKVQNWDIHLFPVNEAEPNQELNDIMLHDNVYGPPKNLDKSVRIVNDAWPLLKSGWPLPRGARIARRLLRRLSPIWEDRAWRLARTIDKIKPDIIHSHEIIIAGNLVYEAQKHLKGDMPPWIVSNWGSDLYLMGRLAENVTKAANVVSACDYYTCECQRDIKLAHSFGLQGEVLGVIPNTGGYDVEKMQQLRQPGPTSSRKIITLKGYQNSAGRALVGLRALQLCSDHLQGYHVIVYSTDYDVKVAIQTMARTHNVSIEIAPPQRHNDMLSLHGRSRISIGLSISDAISTSVLEAMAMGAFPIQSNSSCACDDGWFEDGKSGLNVPPEDPEPIAEAIRCALTDDKMVNDAAIVNLETIYKRMSTTVILPKVVEMYEKIYHKNNILKEKI